MAESGSSGDIQAVQRVAQLLTEFTVHSPQLSIAEAAARVGLNRTTVARYFGSMVSAGLLERSPDEPAAYVPGRLLLQLGALAQGQRQVLALAPRYLRRLSQEAGLTAVLSLLGARGPVVSLVAEVTDFPILITVRVGSVLDMDSAQGHLFLRWAADRDPVESFAASLSKPERERLEGLAAAASDRGLAAADNPGLDLSVLSAPVFDDRGIVATVALIGTTTRLPPEGSATHETPLLRAAYLLTEELGGDSRWRGEIATAPPS